MKRVSVDMFIVSVLVFALMPVFLNGQVRTGAEQTGLYYPLLKDKQIGIVANQASVVDSENIVDILVQRGFKIVRIFSPEHGFRTSSQAGQKIGNSIDPITGIPVVSLYGSRKKPASADMKSLDLILFDIQDVGVRFYTYISTLSYLMEACAEDNVPLILLDRPNPNGFYIDGPVLEKEYMSFVGMHQVPVVYGMTIGEYAQMVNGEGWLKNSVKCDLKVIPLENYTHRSRYDIRVKPSPNLVNQNAINLYPSLCFFEGTNISVGRGTLFPFQVYGHPELNYGSFSFTPQGIMETGFHPPLEGIQCHGEDLRKYYTDHPEESGKILLSWLIQAYNGWNGHSGFFTDYFNKLAGNSTLQEQIIQHKSESEIRQSWNPGIERFKTIRRKYLLYDE